MTRLQQLTHLYPSFVGFDNLFNEIERMVANSQPPAQTYPPHNVIKVEDNKYVVEMAVAGFSKDDITIQLEDGTLVIKGEKKDKSDMNYVYRGIATRAFTKSIRLAETMEVAGAEFKDGILRVGLENIVPDHKKPRQIAISDALSFNGKQTLLTE